RESSWRFAHNCLVIGSGAMLAARPETLQYAGVSPLILVRSESQQDLLNAAPSAVAADLKLLQEKCSCRLCACAAGHPEDSCSQLAFSGFAVKHQVHGTCVIIGLEVR